MNLKRFEQKIREGVEKFQAAGGVLIWGDWSKTSKDGKKCGCALTATYDLNSDGSSESIREIRRKACEDLEVPYSFNAVDPFIDGFDGFDDQHVFGQDELFDLGVAIREEYESTFEAFV